MSKQRQPAVKPAKPDKAKRIKPLTAMSAEERFEHFRSKHNKKAPPPADLESPS